VTRDPPGKEEEEDELTAGKEEEEDELTAGEED